MSDADHLRRRALHLRALATAIEGSPVFALDRYAAEDTWRGGRSDDCRAELAMRQADLYQAIEQLVTTAWWLDRRADVLDAVDAASWG